MTPEQIRAAIRASLERRSAFEQTVSTVRAAIGENQPTEEQATQLREARAGIASVDAEIDQHQAALADAVNDEQRAARATQLRQDLGGTPNQRADRPAGGARVTSEERTYSSVKSLRGQASFFSDAYRAEQLSDMSARERLQRHSHEVIVEGEMQGRALATGGLASLVVPQYLVDLAASVMRTGRPIANAVTPLPLPEQGMTLTVPRGTTGAAVASQATENTALQNTDEVWADLQIPVRTIGGQQDVSRQSLERGTPGVDEIVYLDLTGAYHAELDRQVLNGSGASGQMLGILQTAGIAAATAFGAAPTFANFNSKLAGLIATIAGVGRGITPALIGMHPRRWGWLTSLTDTAGRPLIVPTAQGAFNAGGLNTAPGAYGGDDANRGVTVVGNMQGLPIVTDANEPTTVGTNSEDLVTVFDPRHALLWEEGDGMPRQLRFEQTLGNQLTTKLVIYGYAAFTAGRYPQAFGKIGGVDTTASQGLVAPTF